MRRPTIDRADDRAAARLACLAHRRDQCEWVFGNDGSVSLVGMIVTHVAGHPLGSGGSVLAPPETCSIARCLRVSIESVSALRLVFFMVISLPGNCPRNSTASRLPCGAAVDPRIYGARAPRRADSARRHRSIVGWLRALMALGLWIVRPGVDHCATWLLGQVFAVGRLSAASGVPLDTRPSNTGGDHRHRARR